mmetsp:Transcript_18103/g.45038  ORF Transcript_18103/g.45038 Transcript_18103/m.45038 type:complete len:271 (-) Transcript_18103:426-1238(-)
MKRPRESTHSSCGENDVPRSQLEGEVTCESLFPLVFASSHRDQRSRQHRCGSQRRSSFLPRNFLVGACFIAALALSSLPEAHALSSTRNIANVNSATSFEDVVFRRIEETKEAENESSNPEECTVPAGKCTQCTFSEQKTYEACKETGKWQEFKCFLPGENTGSEDEDVKFEMRSCKYTDLDNGLAMFQLQLFCLLIGGLAIVSVKRQKKVSMSMFDRRKQGGATSSANVGLSKRSDHIRSADIEEDIEFTPMTNQQRERESLVAHMEVI